MNIVFADTSFYVALSNPRDGLHDAAFSFCDTYRGTVVTTEYVLIETGNFLSRVGDRAVFVELIDELLADRKTRIVPSSPELFSEGLRLYATRSDKNGSFTDSISFVVMHQENLTAALTSDHHFEQAGFKPLLV